MICRARCRCRAGIRGFRGGKIEESHQLLPRAEGNDEISRSDARIFRGIGGDRFATLHGNHGRTRFAADEGIAGVPAREGALRGDLHLFEREAVVVGVHQHIEHIGDVRRARHCCQPSPGEAVWAKHAVCPGA